MKRHLDLEIEPILQSFMRAFIDLSGCYRHAIILSYLDLTTCHYNRPQQLVKTKLE